MVGPVGESGSNEMLPIEGPYGPNMPFSLKKFTGLSPDEISKLMQAAKELEAMAMPHGKVDMATINKIKGYIESLLKKKPPLPAETANKLNQALSALNYTAPANLAAASSELLSIASPPPS